MSARIAKRLLMAVAGLSAALLTAQPLGAAEVTRVKSDKPNLAVFLLHGPIVGGDLLRLQSAIAGVPASHSVTVILNSGGGSLSEGIKLGLFFHEARIATMVRGERGGCHSACAIAFLGGTRHKDGKPLRIKPSTSQLGFHAFHVQFESRTYTDVDMSQQVTTTQQIAFALMEYFRQIGEDLRFLPLMLQAPAEKIYLVSSEEALTLGIHVYDENTKNLIDPTMIHGRVQSAMNSPDFGR